MRVGIGRRAGERKHQRSIANLPCLDARRGVTHALAVCQSARDHPSGDSRIRCRIDQDEASRRAIAGVQIEAERPRSFDLRNPNRVHLERVGRLLIKRRYVDSILDLA